jgi:cell division septum initiation protein DivIVA
VHEGLQGYSRAEVDDFLGAIATERLRLQAAIEDANRRITRARSAISMHRVMVAMLLDAQREFVEIRKRSQAEADEIVAAAELQARATIDVARTGAAARDRVADTPSDAAEPMIDLISPAGPAPDAPTSQNGSPPFAPSDDPDGFFDYLRGALVDDRPLGPID